MKNENLFEMNRSHAASPAVGHRFNRVLYDKYCVVFHLTNISANARWLVFALWISIEMK